MLRLLIDAPTRFAEIVAELEMPAEYDLFLEYKVDPPSGEGMPSCSDAMLKSANGALAIEAKWTEPMYETVATWVAHHKDQTNRNAVLAGWLSLLQKRSQIPLLAHQFDAAIYQMVHRAASAATAGKPSLAYFAFKNSPSRTAASPDAVFAQIQYLWNRLGKPDGFPFFMVEIAMEPLDAYDVLQTLPKGEATTGNVVRAALRDLTKPLFSFKQKASIRKVV